MQPAYPRTSASYAAFRASYAARMLSRSPAQMSSRPADSAGPPGPTNVPAAVRRVHPSLLLMLLAGPSKARSGTSSRTTRSRRLLPKSSHSFSNTFLQEQVSCGDEVKSYVSVHGSSDADLGEGPHSGMTKSLGALMRKPNPAALAAQPHPDAG
jgi:hypothetical protein